MKQLVSLSLLLLVLVGLLIVSRRSGCNPTIAREFLGLADGSLVELKVGDQVLELEVANTPASVSLGLGNRAKMNPDGMLFVFPREGNYLFHMKNMQFDLDLIWICGTTIVDIHHRVSRESYDRGEVFNSSTPVNMVLELTAGSSQELGLEVGRRLEFASP